MTRIFCMLLTYSGAYRNSGTLLIVYHKRETHHISDIRTKPHQRRGLFQSYISHYNCAQYVLLRSEVCDGTRFMFRKATRSHAHQPGGTSQCILELAEQRRRLRFTKRKIPQKLHLFKCTIESICRFIRTCTNLAGYSRRRSAYSHLPLSATSLPLATRTFIQNRYCPTSLVRQATPAASHQ